VIRKIFLYGLGGLAALVALTGIAGLLMNPVIHTKVSIEISKPPAQVFALVRDMESVEKWADFEPGQEKMTMVKLSDSPRKYKANAGGMESTWEEVEAREPAFLHTRMLGHSMNVSGDWRTNIEATAVGSRVTNEIDMRFGNPFFRVIGHLMDSQAEEMKTLKALKKYLEAQP
jgi:carbon monoxide dehydrogenase subunit G